jgi:U3 small nucleolar RNA-associated protein 10
MVYSMLINYPQGLMNPYMTTLLRPLTEVLQSFSSASKTASTDLALWSGVISVLTKSLEADDGGTFVDRSPPTSPKPSFTVFWREDKLSALLPHVLSQVPIAVHLPSPPPVTTAPSETPPKTPRERVVSCLLSVAALLPNASSDLLKRLNLDLLMHTRSEDARVRLLALACATETWKAEGGKLVGASSPLDPCLRVFTLVRLGFVGETATFIAECAEDENDSVVREAHELKNAVESVAGSIGGL